MIDLRLGRWQHVLQDVTCDAFISDPPYGGVTHAGHNKGEEQTRSVTGQSTRTAISYTHLTEQCVDELVGFWSPRTHGWFCAMTSDELVPAYKTALKAAGRYVFAAVPIIQKRPRLLGDGPASWAVYLIVARPRNREFATWGCLPGCYESYCEKGTGIAGAKPVDLMRTIIRDYSKPNDLICDAFSGGGTTLLAAAIEGRRAVGAEMDPKHYEIARKRIAKGYTPTLFSESANDAEQLKLGGDE